jgi:hypothetical protein
LLQDEALKWKQLGSWQDADVIRTITTRVGVKGLAGCKPLFFYLFIVKFYGNKFSICINVVASTIPQKFVTNMLGLHAICLRGSNLATALFTSQPLLRCAVFVHSQYAQCPIFFFHFLAGHY